MNIDDGNYGDDQDVGNVGNNDADEEDLLSEVPPRQKHHEVRPRNLAKALGVILVKKGAPPEIISETPLVRTLIL